MYRKDDDWYLLRVRPRYEQTASTFLTKQIGKIDVYYPVAVRDGVELAMFPGYMYARFLRSVPNLGRVGEYCPAKPAFIMRCSADGETLTPLVVRDTQVTQLRLMQLAGEFDEKEDPFIKQIVGMKIKVPSGMFMGYYGRVQSVVDGIAKIRLNMLNSRFYISLAIDDLR